MVRKCGEISLQPGKQRGQLGVHLVGISVQNLPVGFIDENHLAGREVVHELNVGAGECLAGK